MNTIKSTRWVRSLAVILTIIFVSGCNNPVSSDADPLQAFTGAHTRVVWVQEQGGGGDTYGFGENFKLMGYDSRDGKKERPLLKESQNFYKPIITPDGKSVVVSSRSRHEIYVVDFKRGKKKHLGKGVAVDVWQDPETGTTWVYALAGDGPENKYFTTRPLIRFPIKKPKKRETVWNKTHLSWSNFDMSRDGKFAGGLFPWPHAGILLFEQDTWKKYGKGCWTALSPDNSAILWVFDGLHRNLNFVNPFTAEFWTTNINNAPGIGGFEVYHPRWSNHIRYLTMTGPYVEGEGGNKINGGGTKVEIYIGRFSPDLKTVEGWFQVSHNNLADFYPDVWVEGGDTSTFGSAVDVATENIADKQDISWPGEKDSLVFWWQNVMAENKLGDDSLLGFSQFRVTPEGRARFNRFLEMDLQGSGLTASLPGKKIATILEQHDGIGLEILYTPAATTQSDTGKILTLSGDTAGGDQVLLRQDGTSLRVQVLSEGKEIASLVLPDALQDKRPEHIFVSISSTALQLSINGQERETVAIPGSLLQNAKDIQLQFGSLSGNGRGVNGALSHIALYTGSQSQSSISQRAQMVTGELEAREAVDSFSFRGELIEASVVPAPESLGAYSRALVVNRYRIGKLQLGNYVAPEVLVAQWAVLDRSVLPETADFLPGKKVQIVVEKVDDHPELEGERLMMDMFDPDLELYYQVDS